MNNLQHIGILGMKWGRRKGPDNSSPDHSVSRELKKKKLNELSNEELKKLTNRLQLEKQFKDLTKPDISPGKKFVTDLLVGALKNEGSAALTKLSQLLAPHVKAFIENKIKKG